VTGKLGHLTVGDKGADRNQAAVARREINAIVWSRPITAASVTMLRSRGDSAGRFHTSPSSRSCVYLSKAGATI